MTKKKKGKKKDLGNVDQIPSYPNQAKFGPPKSFGNKGNQNFSRKPINIVRHKG